MRQYSSRYHLYSLWSGTFPLSFRLRENTLRMSETRDTKPTNPSHQIRWVFFAVIVAEIARFHSTIFTSNCDEKLS